jgi:hypothetical protein
MLSTVCTALTVLLASGPGQCTPPLPPAALTFEISTSGSAIVVNYQGIQVTAARLSLTPNQDALVLDGQVQINHQNVHITAEHVKIHLSSGAIEVGTPQPQPPTPTAPPVVPVTPACTTTGGAGTPFSFGPGFYR